MFGLGGFKQNQVNRKNAGLSLKSKFRTTKRGFNPAAEMGNTKKAYTFRKLNPEMVAATRSKIERERENDRKRLFVVTIGLVILIIFMLSLWI